VGEELARQYRGLVIFGPFEPVDPQEISALEREVGQTIPLAYRAFLDVANGGTLPYSVRVPPGPQGEPISFSDLYRLGRDRHGEYGWETLLGEYRRLPQSWLAGHLPVATLLPVARTGGATWSLWTWRPIGTVRFLASSMACRDGPGWRPATCRVCWPMTSTPTWTACISILASPRTCGLTTLTRTLPTRGGA
jgi:hypothetical protein